MVVKKKAKKKVRSVRKKSVDGAENVFEEMAENTEQHDKEMHVGKKTREKENRQLIWFFAIVVAVFVIFLGTYFYMQGLKTFEFAGVEWAKEKYQDFDLYHSRFPIIYNGELIANYNLFLRNDPRKNNIYTNVRLGFQNEVVISHEEEAGDCRGAVRITGDLSMFLNAFPFVNKISGAVNDEEDAERLGLPFADCSSEANKTVIVVQKSSGDPSIVMGGEKGECYILNIGQCENTRTIERFMIEIVKQLNFKKV